MDFHTEISPVYHQYYAYFHPFFLVLLFIQLNCARKILAYPKKEDTNNKRKKDKYMLTLYTVLCLYLCEADRQLCCHVPQQIELNDNNKYLLFLLQNYKIVVLECVCIIRMLTDDLTHTTST